MTQTSTLVKVIALLLMLLVGQRGWALITLDKNADELTTLFEDEKAGKSGTVLATRLSQIAEKRDALSEDQKTRFDAMHTRISRTHLDNCLLLSASGTATIPLSQISNNRLTLGSSTATKVKISVKNGHSVEGDSLLAGLTINGTPLNDEQRSVELNVTDLSAGANKPMRVSAALASGVKRDYEVRLQQDNNAPQLKFLVSDRGLVELDEDQRIGLKNGQKVDIIVQDETLIRHVTLIDQSTGKESKLTNEMTARFYHTFDASVGTSKFSVVAEDWAANQCRYEFTFGKWRRPAPSIASIMLGDEDLMSSEVVSTNRSLVDIALKLKDDEIGHRIFLNVKNQTYKMLAQSGVHTATAISLGGNGTWVGEIMLDQGDRQLSLAKIRIRVDQIAPTIQVVDVSNNDPKVASPVNAKSGSSWSVKIEDNEELKSTSATAKPSNAIHIKRKKTLSSTHEYDVKVDGDGVISITATDKAGNTSTKQLTFNLIAQRGPNDGKGPDVSLWHEEREIPAEKRVFFWGRAPKANLHIQDQSGIDFASLKFERCASLSTKSHEASTDVTLPIHLDCDPFIKVSDSYGKETRRTFQIQVVSDQARISVDSENGIVKKLPCRFEFDIAEVVPSELVSVELVDPDGNSTELESGQNGIKNQGVINKLPGGMNGKWLVRLRFQAFDGLKNIAEAKFVAEIGKEKVE